MDPRNDSSPRNLSRVRQLIRDEHGALVGWLVARIGHRNLALAEDMAQEALVEALSNWPYRGIPDHPSAWLKTVARNRAIDQLRRGGKEVRWTPSSADEAANGSPENVFEARVPDAELRLLLLCGHEQLGEEDRLALSLKVAGGFTAREIAAVLLKAESAISQRLARAKRKLRQDDTGLAEEPTPTQIRQRTRTALKVVYLAFSHGYAPRSGDQLVRRDLCRWALRLSRECAQNQYTQSGQSWALHALLCFQSSRLDAREDAAGLPVLMDQQDRSMWDKALINEGLLALEQAREGDLSRFHLEAAIASLHASAPHWKQTDWSTMLGLYQHLFEMTGSPVVALNGAVARALSGDCHAALEALDALGSEPCLVGYAPYHVARADVLKRLGLERDSAAARQTALDCGASAPVMAFLDAAGANRNLQSC